jgi:hypothetical protein
MTATTTRNAPIKEAASTDLDQKPIKIVFTNGSKLTSNLFSSVK